MKQWFTAKEIAGLPGLPGTERSIIRLAERERWESQKKAFGKGWEYHASHLPLAAREALAARVTSEVYHSGQADGEKLALAAGTQTQALRRTGQAGLKALTGLSGKARARAEAKLAILTMLDLHVSTLGGSFEQGLQSFMRLYMGDQLKVEPKVKETIPTFTRATVFRWIKELNESGVARLGGQYCGRQGAGLIDSQPLLKQYVLGLLAAYPHTSPSNMMKAVEAQFRGRPDVTLPAKRSLQKWLKSWKEQNAGLFRAVTNPDAWKNRDMVGFGSAREGIVALNQLWEFDSTPADVMFKDGRHSILGVIDVYSLRLKFIVRKTSDSRGVAAVVRRALLDWGVPQGVKTDNGSDYKSLYIQTVFKALGVQQAFCDPFCGWQKPHIERAFETFLHDAVELLPGFIGHNVAERKAIEARKAFSERLFKKGEVVESQLTAEEFATFADRWVASVYEPRPHSTLRGQSPLEMVRNWPHPLARIDDERSLDILLAEAPGNNGRRTVGKKGIKLDNGLYIAPELGAHVNEPVMVRYDEADMGRIFVYDTLGHFLCIAEDPDITGVSRQEVAYKAKQIQKESIEGARRELKRLARQVKKRDVAELILADQEAQRAALNVTELPKRSERHSSPGLEAAADAARALDKRSADSFETAAPMMEQSEFERRRNEILAQQTAVAAATAPKAPIFENEYQRAWWLTQEKEKRELGGEEAAFLKGYRTKNPGGAKSLDALAAAMPGGSQQIGKTPAQASQ